MVVWCVKERVRVLISYCRGNCICAGQENTIVSHFVVQGADLIVAIACVPCGYPNPSHQKLYIESGFCTLKERRKRHKLLMFHKMIPPLVAHINPYHRRRPLERDVTIHAKLNFIETPSFHLPQQSGILSPLAFNKVHL